MPSDIRITPGIQKLLDLMPKSAAPATVPSTAPGGGGFFGSIYDGFSSLVGESVGVGVNVLETSLEVIDASRVWVAQPVLGLGVATWEGDFSGINDVSDLRRKWEEANLPGIVKFGAELLADPLMWTGLGLWKTPAVRLAQRALPVMLRDGVKANIKTGLAQVKAARILDTSSEAKLALKTLAVGKPLETSAVPGLRKAMRQAGLPTEFMDDVVRASQEVDPAFLKANFAPGLAQKVLGSPGVMRALGPLDLFAEHLWQMPFAGVAPYVARFSPQLGKMVVGGMNSAGQNWVVDKVLAVGTKIGPVSRDPRTGKVTRAPIHALREAAQKGEAVTWLLRPSPDRVNREAFRRASTVRQALGEFSAKSGRATSDIITGIRNGDDALTKLLPVDPEDLSILQDAVSKTRLDEEVFAQMMTSPDEETLFFRVGASMGQAVSERLGFVADPAVAVSELTFVNRGWAFTERLIKAWKPWVTSMNPSFQVLNLMDNAVQRGGLGMLLAGPADLRETSRVLANLGFDPSLAKSMAKSPKAIWEEVGTETASRLESAKVGDTNVGTFLTNPEPAGPIAEGMHDPRRGFARRTIGAAQAFAVHNDAAAQGGLALRGTSEQFFRDVLLTGVDDPAFRVRAVLDELTAARVGPQWEQEVKDAAVAILGSDDPARTFSDISRRLNLDNITMSSLQNNPKYWMMPQQWQEVLQIQAQKHLDSGLPFRSSLLRAMNDADLQISQLGSSALKTMKTEGRHFENLVDQIYSSLGVSGVRLARQRAAKRMQVSVAAVGRMANELAPKDRALASRFKELTTGIPLASRNVDAYVYGSMSDIAKDSGMLSGMVMPAFEDWIQRAPEKISDRLGRLAHELDAYRVAAPKQPEEARRILRRMGGLHGDFVELANRDAIPPVEQVVSRFIETGENVWYKYIGEKLEVADWFHDLYKSGRFNPLEVAGILDKAEKEIFMAGDTARRHLVWAERYASKMGILGERLPMTGRVKQQTLIDAARVVKQEEKGVTYITGDFLPYPVNNGKLVPLMSERMDVTEINPGFVARFANRHKELIRDFPGLAVETRRIPGNKVTLTLNAVLDDLDEAKQLAKTLNQPTVFDTETGKATGIALGKDVKPVEGRAELSQAFSELRTLRGRAVASDAFDKSVQELFVQFQQSYELLGRASTGAVRKVLPKNHRKFLLDTSKELRETVLGWGLNEEADLAGVAFMQKILDRTLELTKDVRFGNRVQGMLRSAMSDSGLALMRNRMVDYSMTTNTHRILQSIFPFASFQLHLPGFLARTFQERPGLIAAMNHFAQEAQENFGVSGGMFLGGGWVMAPQLRFSYLPVMAGRNFVRPGDHPMEQLNDIASLFGFSPGPHVQLAMDGANIFASQIGLPEAAPEFRFGIIPQWRFVQDLTAMMGINNSQGLQVPFLSPSADIREREVKRELAARVSSRLESEKVRLGRDLHPGEVEDVRRFVLQSETEDARFSVAGRDLALGLIPGLRFRNPEEQSVRNRVAAFLGTRGIEAKPAEVFGKWKELPKFDQLQLLREVPEFEDLLNIPPFQETKQRKRIRVLRNDYFGAVDSVLAERSREQRKIDAAFNEGQLLPEQYRELRGDLRTRASAAISGLQHNPDFKSIADAERDAPTRPEESAYLTFTTLEPQDLNGNGVIDSEDMRGFFDARHQFFSRQPGWVQTYIRDRQSFNMTETEQLFTVAQNALDGFFRIPAFVGFTPEASDRAQSIITKARALARIQPGPTPLDQIILQMPGLSQEDRMLAIVALQTPSNPARFKFWVQHTELDTFYPEFRPDPLSQ